MRYITVIAVFLFLTTQCFAQQTLFVKDLKNYPVTIPWYAKSVAKDKFGSYWMLAENSLQKFNRAGTEDFTQQYKLSLDGASFIACTKDDELLIFYKGKKQITRINFLKNESSNEAFTQVVDSMVHDAKSIYILSNNKWFDFYSKNEVAAAVILPAKYVYDKKNTYITAGGTLKDSIKHIFYHNNITTIQTHLTWFEISEPVNNNISYYSNKLFPSLYCRAIFPFKNKILLSFDKAESLFVQDGNTVIDLLKLPFNTAIDDKIGEEIIFHAGWLDETHLILLTNNSLAYIMDIDTYAIRPYRELNKLNLTLKNLCNGKNNTVYFGTYTGDFVIHNAKSNYTKVVRASKENLLTDVFRLYEDKNQILWLGMQKGVAAYNTKTGELFTEQINTSGFVKSEVAAMAVDSKNRFWWGNYGSLLQYCDYNVLYANIKAGKRNIFDNVAITNFNSENKFPSFVIRYINMTSDKIIVRTNDGLAVINSDDLSYKYITNNNGFAKPLSNQYNYVVGNSYLTGVEGGYAWINLNDKQIPAFSPKLSFEEVYFGSVLNKDNFEFSLSKQLKTTVDNPFITIKVANYFQTSFEDNYWYKVDNGPWIKAPENLLTISTNNPGTYKIYLKNIASSYHNTADQTEIITIFVKTPWYASFWFYSLILMALAGFAYYFYRLLQSEKRNREKAKQFEMVSLRSQMNPHFISNSLNSINLYVLENKSDEASSYIVKFSKLIRRILNYSEQEFISINDEIQMVENYLDMEKLRFKDKFNYTVEYVEPVDKAYKVPSLIVQPIVENAVWHGLLQNNSKGNLAIKIIQHGKGLTVTVEDNGIGRTASLALKSKMATKQKSFGISIINKRFDLINEQGDKNLSITVADKNADGTGTIVTLNV